MKKFFQMAFVFLLAVRLLPVGAQEDVEFSSFDSFDDGAAVSPVTVNGTAKMDMRAYLDKERIDDTKNAVAGLPSFMLDLGYAGNNAEVQAKLFVSRDAVAVYPQDILRELTMRAYLGDFVLEGGKMNIVWGKGDNLHVLDNFNANDYTDFIIPDRIDRRIAEPMLRGIWNASNGLRAELVYTPLMTADRYASESVWTPAVYTNLVSAVTTVLGAQGTVALDNDDAASLLAVMQKTNSLTPAAKTLKYGQAGARLTGTAGVFDWGVSYYYGHYKQPTADMSGYAAAQQAATVAAATAVATGSPANPKEAAAKAIAALGDRALPSLHYDMLQVFGLEGAAAIGRVNLRAEAGYYLTEDVAGDNPWIHNNSVQWLFGFDVDLPLHNVNVNVQTIGMYILGNSKIGSGEYKPYETLDADYSADGRYTNNKLAVNISDTFLREKMKLECFFLWEIERGDLLIIPKASYMIKDGMSLTASGLYITGKDDGAYAEWHGNSFVQLGLKYQF